MFQIALFGAGRIGQVHARHIASHPRSRLHSVVDPNATAAQRTALQFGARARTADEVFADPEIDAVLIASATDTHAGLIEHAAAAGKAIFCEKPIDLDLARVRACLATVERRGAPLFVGFNRRFDPQFRSLYDALRAGRIGRAETLSITSRDPAPPSLDYVRVSGGLFRDMTIHDFDLARWIIGADPVAVTAQGACLVDPAIGAAGDIDTAVVTLEFPNGCLATISNSRRSGYGYDQRVELHGSMGLLQARNVHENTLVTTTDAGGRCAAKPLLFFLERYAQAYAAEWDHFVADVIDGHGKPLVTGTDGERALQIAQAAQQALHSGVKQRLEWR